MERSARPLLPPAEREPRVRILVTGGSGFVGRHTVARLVAGGHKVVALQRGETSAPGATVLRRDLVELTPDDLPGRFDIVIHLAARLDNPFGVDRTLAELAMPNIIGTLRLLEAAAAIGVERFVHGSTGGVGRNPPPGGRMLEDDPPGPVNAYGLTKHLAEQAVRTYAWPFERVSVRYFAPYGRDGSNPMFQHILDCLEAGTAIEVGAGGTPELNPIHIEDAVEATVRAAAAPDLPAVINLAGPDIASLGELAGLLARATGRTALLRERAAASPSWVADTQVMRRYLGAPRVPLVDGIEREFGRG